MSSPAEEEELLKNPRKSKAFKRLEKKLTIDLLFIWVLRLLKEGPKYAYELKNEFQEKFGFSPATVTNYTVLYLLEKEGIVKRVEATSEGERIDRKYYAMTEVGEKLMNESEQFLKDIYTKLFPETSINSS